MIPSDPLNAVFEAGERDLPLGDERAFISNPQIVPIRQVSEMV